MKTLAKLTDRVLGRFVPKTGAAATVCWFEERDGKWCEICATGTVNCV